MDKSISMQKNEEKRRKKLEKYQAKRARPIAKKLQKLQVNNDFVNTTLAGDKKDMTQHMEASYNPISVESSWYHWWENKDYFKPKKDNVNNDKDDKDTYVILLPPPNVTGVLHIGHALTISIQDSLIRFYRMCGKNVLYVPGIDHAGIATQSVVEKKIMREKGLTRHELGRENFLENVWDWKSKNGDEIFNQIKRMATSVDWNRLIFSMDPKISNAVNKAFISLYKDGTIYRETKMVNWSCALNTALSNLEVDFKELTGKTMLSLPLYNEKVEFGVLVYFAYEIENSTERIVVATTRIETMLGDTAIAVNSKDIRYQHLHKKYAKHPFNNRRIPIIFDDIAVDMSFGTGAVKITPAHDINDYQVSKRHNLEIINIFNDDGTINSNGGVYKDMKRFDVRKQIIIDLTGKNLFVEKKNHAMSVPICSRSGDVVEPFLKPQWWINCKNMAQEAINVVKTKQLVIEPKTSENEWFRWLENIQDWCISRQLWWGHRIPAYIVEFKDKNLKNEWVVALSEKEASQEAALKFPNTEFTLKQDSDVFDTWFSAALWPFAVFGWPEESKDFNTYFPSTLLETGQDILFFWVARMVMLGLKLTGKVPFKKVFCHAMVRDSFGRKMSKSLGNVINPIDIIEGISLSDLSKTLEKGNLDPSELNIAKKGQKNDYPNGIPQCGTDALRFALCSLSVNSASINLDVLQVNGYRRFCNKLWNATRFALMQFGTNFIPNATSKLSGKELLWDLWILEKLDKIIQDCNNGFKSYNFKLVTTSLYNFWWYELCDVYIEKIKDMKDEEEKKVSLDVLYTCFDQGLKLLHPIMPYITEELYQRLKRRPDDNIESIMISSYPTDLHLVSK